MTAIAERIEQEREVRRIQDRIDELEDEIEDVESEKRRLEEELEDAEQELMDSLGGSSDSDFVEMLEKLLGYLRVSRDPSMALHWARLELEQYLAWHRPNRAETLPLLESDGSDA